MASIGQGPWRPITKRRERAAGDRGQPEFPAKTLKEFMDAARAKPGALNYGHAGIGTQTHLAAENFLSAAKLDVTAFPTRARARR